MEGSLNLFDIILREDCNGLKLYLKSGGDPNCKVKSYGTLLACAAAYGKISVVSLLVKHPHVKINCSPWKMSALTFACLNGHKEIVALLLKQDHIDVNFCTRGIQSALIYAIEEKNIDIVTMLLNYPGVKIISNAINALIYADESKESEIVKLILQSQAAILNIPNAVVIHKGKMLLKHTGFEVTRSVIGKEMLWRACERDLYDVVDMILSWGLYEKREYICDDMTKSLLAAWKMFLPPWTRYAVGCKYYPKEFHDIAICTLLVLRKCKVVTDIQHMILSLVAENWKLE